AATESWSRSRESSLSIDAHGKERRSRTDRSAGAGGPPMALVSRRAAAEKSGNRPFSTMARRAMLLSRFLACATARFIDRMIATRRRATEEGLCYPGPHLGYSAY